ncbi:MAG: hypothetical protein ACOC04_05795 [Halothece sp.]
MARLYKMMRPNRYGGCYNQLALGYTSRRLRLRPSTQPTGVDIHPFHAHSIPPTP